MWRYFAVYGRIVLMFMALGYWGIIHISERLTALSSVHPDIADFKAVANWVGAAVRSIHENCNKITRKYLSLQPVLDQEEGQSLTLQKGGFQGIRGNVSITLSIKSSTRILFLSRLPRLSRILATSEHSRDAINRAV